MLTMDNTVLVIVDVQGNLAGVMHDRDLLFDNLQRIIKGARALDLPILWTEQNPQGLGPTISKVADLLPDIRPMAKMSFSCCGCAEFSRALDATGRGQVLLAGIETHVCVYQTSVDLMGMGYEVHVVADAVSSRTASNKHIGLDRTTQEGATLTSVELALFELLRTAEAPRFREILKIVR